ncbi:hypothetical protein SBA6_730009 [Candidatus Sulfopaludibacter sp. SbA6]|nr:hypothetical protein SBA6_730009 [Candidatus Sulfopaludibacter sp. SbA6]
MNENASVLFEVWETGTSWIEGKPKIKRIVGSFRSRKEADLCVYDYRERPGESGYHYRYDVKVCVIPNP